MEHISSLVMCLGSQTMHCRSSMATKILPPSSDRYSFYGYDLTNTVLLAQYVWLS